MLNATKISDTGDVLPTDAKGHAAVLVPATGLMWAAATLPNLMTVANAENACAALNLAGFADWRLPTVEELFLLADRSRHSPAIDTDFFPGTKSDWYWSSSPGASAPADYAWYVYFNGGDSDYYHRDDVAFVRAVRSVGASQ